MLKAMLNRNNISTILFVGISSAIIISGISGCSSSAGEAGSQATVKGATVENAQAQNTNLNEIADQTDSLLKEEFKNLEKVTIIEVKIITPEQFDKYQSETKFPNKETLINIQTYIDDRKNDPRHEYAINEGYIFLATVNEKGSEFKTMGVITRDYDYQPFEIHGDFKMIDNIDYSNR